MATMMIPAAAPPELTPFDGATSSFPEVLELIVGPVMPDVVDLEIVDVAEEEVPKVEPEVVVEGWVGHAVTTGSKSISPLTQVLPGVLRYP